MSIPPPNPEALDAQTTAPASPPPHPRARRFSRAGSSKSSTTVNENEERSRPDFSKHASVWGEEISVNRPIDVNDPGFPALKRALTGSRHEDDWTLEKQLKGAQKNLQDQGHTTDKRLDVSWHGLSVRGVGKDAMVSSTSYVSSSSPLPSSLSFPPESCSVAVSAFLF